MINIFDIDRLFIDADIIDDTALYQRQFKILQRRSCFDACAQITLIFAQSIDRGAIRIEYLSNFLARFKYDFIQALSRKNFTDQRLQCLGKIFGIAIMTWLYFALLFDGIDDVLMGIASEFVKTQTCDYCATDAD